MTRRRSGLVFAGVVLAAWPAAAQPKVTLPVETPGVVDVRTVDPHSFRAVAVRVPDGMTPKIDGNLDDALWELLPSRAASSSASPIVGAPSTERTEFRVAVRRRSSMSRSGPSSPTRAASSPARCCGIRGCAKATPSASCSTRSMTIGTGSTSAPTRSGRRRTATRPKTAG